MKISILFGLLVIFAVCVNIEAAAGIQSAGGTKIVYSPCTPDRSECKGATNGNCISCSKLQNGNYKCRRHVHSEIMSLHIFENTCYSPSFDTLTQCPGPNSICYYCTASPVQMPDEYSCGHYILDQPY